MTSLLMALAMSGERSNVPKWMVPALPDSFSAAIVQSAAGVDVQQAAAAALRGGCLGDEFGRQLVVELGELEIGIHGQAG